MINAIFLRDFRHFKELELFPRVVNVIEGPRGCGKTSLLEAIAFTDSNDSEFLSVLLSRRYDPSKPLIMRKMVENSFFSHDRTLESFRSKINFIAGNTRLLEIWKTSEDIYRSTGNETYKQSPYIFVYDSVDPTQVTPRCVPYDKVERLFQSMMTRPREWPINYVAHFPVMPPSIIANFYRQLMTTEVFCSAVQSMLNFFEDLESIHLLSDGLHLQLTGAKDPLPLSCCPGTLCRILTILIAATSRRRPYLLLDEIEQGLTERETEWLVDTLSIIVLQSNLQLFVTTSRPSVKDLFRVAMGKKSYRFNLWKLPFTKTESDTHALPQRT